MDGLGRIFGNADALLVSLKDKPSFTLAIPGRVAIEPRSGKAGFGHD
jgi:hypothetical protein